MSFRHLLLTVISVSAVAVAMTVGARQARHGSTPAHDPPWKEEQDQLDALGKRLAGLRQQAEQLEASALLRRRMVANHPTGQPEGLVRSADSRISWLERHWVELEASSGSYEVFDIITLGEKCVEDILGPASRFRTRTSAYKRIAGLHFGGSAFFTREVLERYVSDAFDAVHHSDPTLARNLAAALPTHDFPDAALAAGTSLLTSPDAMTRLDVLNRLGAMAGQRGVDQGPIRRIILCLAQQDPSESVRDKALETLQRFPESR